MISATVLSVDEKVNEQRSRTFPIACDGGLELAGRSGCVAAPSCNETGIDSIGLAVFIFSRFDTARRGAGWREEEDQRIWRGAPRLAAREEDRFETSGTMMEDKKRDDQFENGRGRYISFGAFNFRSRPHRRLSLFRGMVYTPLRRPPNPSPTRTLPHGVSGTGLPHLSRTQSTSPIAPRKRQAPRRR